MKTLPESLDALLDGMINKFPWWSFSATDCISSLFTNDSIGLSEQEAENRLQKFGPNELPQEEKKSLFSRFLEQFDDLLVKILLAGAFVSFVLALIDTGFTWDKSQLYNFVEPIVILLILMFNAVIGTWQECNAESAIDALKQFETEEAKVVRHNETPEGKLRTLRGKCLVPGDIVDVCVGDRVPADIRIIKIMSTTLWADQSLLTGESVSVIKNEKPVGGLNAVVNQDKTNLLFSGTTVVRGSCRGVVVATGQSTEIGKIRTAIAESKEERTPLTVKLDEFSQQLSTIISIICVTVWLININHFSDPIHGGSWMKGAVYYFKIAVALAVAAIPEGLPAVITTCLALGTARMAKKNAIVRTLPSVETLGCTSVICSDKTGTLTTNQMLVKRFAVMSNDGKPVSFNVSGTTYEPMGEIRKEGFEGTFLGAQGGPCIRNLCLIAALCNDASLTATKIHNVSDGDGDAEDAKYSYEKMGESTEAALVVLVEKLNMDRLSHRMLANDNKIEFNPMICTETLRKNYPRVLTLEFTRERKSMGVLVETPEMGRMLMVKGAPESVLARCTSYMKENGSLETMKYTNRMAIEQWYQHNSAFRCIAFALINSPPDINASYLDDTDNFVKIESNLTFIGITGIVDPPRPEVYNAVRLCRLAGIRVMMITGDNKATAEHICREVGILEEFENTEDKCFTGLELDSMDEQAKVAACCSAKLFARVEPSHKHKIIECLQSVGEISAMTGDGVNDAPALKKAEIGIAMGSGTAVAKSASDMVLADDNFNTIVSAVEEGRAIFNNMKQFIRYLISSNIGEVVCIFLTAALGLPEALIPVQLLWVNLVTDGLPATALGFNPPDTDIMQKPPRHPSEPLITRWLLFRYVVIGIYVGVATVLSSIWWYVSSDRGPHLPYDVLSNHFKCTSTPDDPQCIAFHTANRCAPMTMALSVLVTIEMLNALNSLSENQSLVTMPPWLNKWLVAACLLSMAQHFVIVYFKPCNAIFQTCPLTFAEWLVVIRLSIPVLLIDETLKLFSRHYLASDLNEPKRGTVDKPTAPNQFGAAILAGVWALYFGCSVVCPLFQ